jgi:hypothetical protein
LVLPVNEACEPNLPEFFGVRGEVGVALRFPLNSEEETCEQGEHRDANQDLG